MQDILESCEGLPEAQFARNETLIEEGEVADKLYILREGGVVVRKGRTDVTRVSEPGAVFGEISALIGAPTTARVVAVSTVRTYVVENAREFLIDHPRLAFHTAQILAGRLMRATEYLADLKREVDGSASQFGRVDQVLDSLLQQQERWDQRSGN